MGERASERVQVSARALCACACACPCACACVCICVLPTLSRLPYFVSCQSDLSRAGLSRRRRLPVFSSSWFFLLLLNYLWSVFEFFYCC